MNSKSHKPSLSSLPVELASHKDFEAALRAAQEANHGEARRRAKQDERARLRAKRAPKAPAVAAAPSKSERREQALELWSAVSDVHLGRVSTAFAVGMGMSIKKVGKALELEYFLFSDGDDWLSGPEGFLRGGLFKALDNALCCGNGRRRIEEVAMLLDKRGVVLGYGDMDLVALAEAPLADPAAEAVALRERRRRGLKTWAGLWGRIDGDGRKALLAVCGSWLAEPAEAGGIEHGDWLEAAARPGPAEGLAGRILMIGQCGSAFGASLTALQWRGILNEIAAMPNSFNQSTGNARGFRFGLRKSLRLALAAPGEPLDVESARILAAIAVESDDIKLLRLVFERSAGVDWQAPPRWWRFVAEAEWVGHGDNPDCNYRLKDGPGAKIWDGRVEEVEAWGASQPLSLLHLALVDSACNPGGRKCFQALVQIPQMLAEAVNHPCPRIIARRKAWEVGWLVKTFPGLGAQEACGLGIGHYWTAMWLDDSTLGPAAFKKVAKSSWAKHLLEPMPAGLAPMGLANISEFMDGKTPFETAKIVLDECVGPWIDKRASKVEREEIEAVADLAEEPSAPRRRMRL